MPPNGIRHHLEWDDDYCLECNSPATDSTPGFPLRCPVCGESWTAHSDRAMGNWQRFADRLLIRLSFVFFVAARNHCQELARAMGNWQRFVDRLLIRLSFVFFEAARNHCQQLARAKAAGFSSGWIHLWPLAFPRLRDLCSHGISAHGDSTENPALRHLSDRVDVLAGECDL